MESKVKLQSRLKSAANRLPAQSTSPNFPQRELRQPAWAAQFDDALLKLALVIALTGLSGSSLYRKVAANEFPAPVRLGSRCSRWRAGDVNRWLRQRAGASQ